MSMLIVNLEMSVWPVATAPGSDLASASGAAVGLAPVRYTISLVNFIDRPR